MTHPRKFVQQLLSATPCCHTRFTAHLTPLDHEGWQSNEELNRAVYTLADHIADLTQDIADGV
jgi:hypothetical protein